MTVKVKVTSKSLQMVTVAMKLKRCLLVGRKATTKLDSIYIKNRDITLLTKVCIVKPIVFPCTDESWTIRKASVEELTLSDRGAGEDSSRVPWTARSNQSILKEISPGCSLEGLMLKLKLQYFGHLMRRADSLEKTLMLGKRAGEEGDNRG